MTLTTPAISGTRAAAVVTPCRHRHKGPVFPARSLPQDTAESFYRSFIVYHAPDRGRHPETQQSGSGMDLSDEELVGLAQEGSRAAFASLVERHKAAVFSMACRVIGNREDAEEAAQDAFVRAFRALDRFRGDSRFSTWLYRIAMNVCLTKARQSRLDVASIDASMDGEEDSAPLQIPDQNDTPDERVERSEFKERVRRLIASLPPKYSAVLTLYHIQDLSYEEISQTLDLPIGTVKAHLFRARNALKRLALSSLEPQELGGA